MTFHKLEIGSVKISQPGLNPHAKLGKQSPLSTLPTHSIPPTSLVQPVDKGLPTHPIPKIGQGRARLRRRFKANHPVSLPKQMPT